ncbi:hypothetical protein AMECASPLE_033300 [Ameca splendens]|uniref:Mpv17-like protein 2 n=3 Tax=Goodeidae TaxID=28758 RepID=A0ABV0YIT9_9TELE
MLPRAGKDFLVRIRFSWRPLFQGRYLLLTNTLSGGIMLSLGDILQQTRENRREPGRVRDWRRTGRMFVAGCSMGPLLHYWYLWLDRVYVGRALKTLSKKVLVDQLVASPTLGMWYFIGMDLLEGRSLSEGWAEFRGKFWEFYKDRVAGAADSAETPRRPSPQTPPPAPPGGAQGVPRPAERHSPSSVSWAVPWASSR